MYRLFVNLVSTLYSFLLKSWDKVVTKLKQSVWTYSHRVDTKLISNWYNLYQPCIDFISEIYYLCNIFVSTLCQLSYKVAYKNRTKLIQSWCIDDTKLRQSCYKNWCLVDTKLKHNSVSTLYQPYINFVCKFIQTRCKTFLIQS
jgi:hypothetical protein